MSVSSVLDKVAVGLEAADAVIEDPVASAITKGAAAVVRLAAEILATRTPEEAVAILEHIRDYGTTPIAQAELDAQIAAAIAKAGGTP